MTDLLILGASGFLGTELARRAVGRVELAMRPRPRPLAVPDSIPLHAWDAARPGATRELLSRLQPRQVLNAAALSKLSACEADPAGAHLLNAELPEELGGLAREQGFRLVHVSTDLVFGGAAPAGERYAESDVPSPVSVYGASKARGEDRVLARAPEALVVRLPLLTGNSHGLGRGATDGLLAAVRAGGRVVLFEDEWRTPLDVGVAAEALLEATRSDLVGILHVAGPERLSRFELGARVLGPRDRSRIQRGRRADLGLEDLRPRDVSLDTSLARSRLRTSLEAVRAGSRSA